MWGAYKGRVEVARLLLEKGANPNITGQVRSSVRHDTIRKPPIFKSGLILKHPLNNKSINKNHFLCTHYWLPWLILQWNEKNKRCLCIFSVRALPHSMEYTPSFGQQVEAMPKSFVFYCNAVLKSTAPTRWLPSSPLSKDVADFTEKGFSLIYVNIVSPVL